MFVGHRYGTFFMSSPYNFEVAPRFMGNICTPVVCYRLHPEYHGLIPARGRDFFSSPKNSEHLWEQISVLLDGSLRLS
jgi:hypothetical protein